MNWVCSHSLPVLLLSTLCIYKVLSLAGLTGSRGSFLSHSYSSSFYLLWVSRLGRSFFVLPLWVSGALSLTLLQLFLLSTLCVRGPLSCFLSQHLPSFVNSSTDILTAAVIRVKKRKKKKKTLAPLVQSIFLANECQIQCMCLSKPLTSFAICFSMPSSLKCCVPYGKLVEYQEWRVSCDHYTRKTNN